MEFRDLLEFVNSSKSVWPWAIFINQCW